MSSATEIVSAIANIQLKRADIINAIENKGVSISTSSKLADLSEKIDLIEATDVDIIDFIWDGTIKKLVIPQGVTELLADLFYNNCSLLTSVTFPPSIINVLSPSFQNCISLTTVTFLGTPTSIGSYAFYACNNLITINVPWSLGAVADAPWGAYYATINYNS